MRLTVLTFMLSRIAMAGFVFDYEVAEGGKIAQVRVPPRAHEFGVTLKDSPFKCMLKTEETETAGHQFGRAELWCCVEKPNLSQCAVALAKCTKEDDGNAELTLLDIVSIKGDKNAKKDQETEGKKDGEEIRRAAINFHCMYIEDRDTASAPPVKAAGEPEAADPSTPPTAGVPTP